MATLGPTSTGGSTFSPITAGTAIVVQYTMPAGGGTITKLSALVNADSSSPLIAPLVYAESGGAPGSLLGYDAEVLVPNTGFAFLDLPTVTHSPGGIFVPAGLFWLGWVLTAGGTVNEDYAAAGGSQAANFAFPTSLPPSDPFGTPTTSSQILTVNATYTPAVAAPVVGLSYNNLPILKGP